MIVLGIETSCDETAAAVVADGRQVLSNVVYSQVERHRPYGGVVPEVASRCHVEVLPAVLAQAVRDAGLAWSELDAVAVTYGPGLASALLVGLAAGKALALRLQRPLIGINHVEAHLYSVFLGDAAPAMADCLPLLALIVSGGHTCLVRMEASGRYRLLGQTVDDAAGEAFDKGAKLLGLGYPGGPVLDRTARTGNPRTWRFPRGRQKDRRQRFDGLDPRLCFSFSGLKTALRQHLDVQGPPADAQALADVAASYQDAIVEALVARLVAAHRDETAWALAGGVSLNSRLRERIATAARARGVRLLLASAAYGADNAAMVAGLAGCGQGITGSAAFNLDVDPSLPGFNLEVV